MNAKVFAISSDLNAAMALGEAEDNEADVTPPLAIVEPEAPTIDPDVRAYLESEGLGEMDVHPGMSRVDIAVQVDKWLAALYGTEERIAEITAVRDKRVAMVTETFDAQIAQQKRAALYIRGRCIEFARTFPYPQGAKSYPLAFGTIGKRKANKKLVVQDSRAVIEWARENVPEAVENVPTLRKLELNEWWASKGEPEDVPGCKVETPTERDAPYVRPKEIA